MRVTIKGDQYTVTTKGQVIDRGMITLHQDKTPQQLDDIPALGEHKGETMQGTYELKGDTWSMCLSESGKPRLKKFTANEATGQTLYVMKRTSK